MPNASGVKRSRGSSAGFSLIELLVVVGIIGLLAAVVGPPIRNYMLTTRIRAGAQQFASEAQFARQKAIGKNVHWGVMILVLSPTTYQWVIEDDQTPPLQNATPTMSALVADDAQHGPVRTLPPGVTFTTPGPTSRGIRFNNLGGACDPNTAGTCPQPDTPTVDLVNFNTINPAEFTVRLTDTTTTLTRNVRVATSGRIFITQ